MNPVYDFTGQVALVTGASSGIGLASAQMFAEAGAAVVLVDINEGALRVVTEELPAAGHQAIGITCDVADEAQAGPMVERAVATFGRLDMAFNNAGIVGFTGDPADESAGSFDRVTAINLRGIWTCMKHELRRRGRPVNVAEKANDVCPRVVSSWEAPSHSDPRGRPNVTPFVTRTSGYETC